MALSIARKCVIKAGSFQRSRSYGEKVLTLTRVLPRNARREESKAAILKIFFLNRSGSYAIEKESSNLTAFDSSERYLELCKRSNQRKGSSQTDG
jgi:hypothetical protein